MLASRVQHLTSSHYRVMPWKNGLGTTTELAIEPEGAALDDFTWRVSIAELRASGPFSPFPGYDRIIVQLEGAPMTLSHAGGGEHRLALLEPHAFAGELATSSTLDGPARDFNVMVRRDRASASVRTARLGPGASLVLSRAPGTHLVYVVRGAVTASSDGMGARAAAGESLLWREEPASAVALTADAGGADVIAASIGAPERGTLRHSP